MTASSYPATPYTKDNHSSANDQDYSSNQQLNINDQAAAAQSNVDRKGKGKEKLTLVITASDPSSGPHSSQKRVSFFQHCAIM